MKVKLNGSTVDLKEGMMLYCASYGVGKIISVSEKEYYGEKNVFCELNISRDNINVLIPVNKMKEMGVRGIISKETAQKIVDTVLSKPAKNAKGIWTKRIVECETKVYSGSPFLLAEVIRDLFAGMKDMNKSYGERMLFDKAFDCFVAEYALACNLSLEESHKIIYDILNKNYLATHKADVEVQENDDIGDDFSDDDIDLDDESIEDSDDSDEKPKRGRQKKTA
jgi:CarD family transcriptional regulator